MIRRRYQNVTCTLPFRIRNSFSRRLLTRLDYNTISNITASSPSPSPSPSLSGSNDNEIMQPEYFKDNEMLLEQGSYNDDEGDVDIILLSSKDNDDRYDEEGYAVEDKYDDDGEYDVDEEYDDDEYYHEEEYYTISSGSEGDDANDLAEEKIFVDIALDEDKLSSFDSNFSPYFQDFTTAALFCWINKHNISTSAYEDLVDIIMNTEFNQNNIVRNIRRFRTWRERLPLLPISAKSISISTKKTPSTSKDSKMAYQLSINDIIWHVLNNPSLMKNMYFGPGVNLETKSEYWHGTLWAESPLFGQEQLMISGGKKLYFDMFINYDIF